MTGNAFSGTITFSSNTITSGGSIGAIASYHRNDLQFKIVNIRSTIQILSLTTTLITICDISKETISTGIAICVGSRTRLTNACAI